MRKTKEEQLALLEETVAYYTEDVMLRCVLPNGCRYSGDSVERPNSNGCAIGRLLTPELRLRLDRIHPNRPVSVVWDHLPDDVKAFGLDYLRELQSLHDRPENWDDNGLSETGQKQYGVIKSRINIEVYQDGKV